MKLTLEHYDQKHTIETKHDDLSVYELFELMRGLFVSAGFQKESIDDVIIEQAQELNEDK